jgi:hypothetical protein
MISRGLVAKSLPRRRRCRFDAGGVGAAQGSRPLRDRQHAGSNGPAIRQRKSSGGALGVNFVGQPFQRRSVRRKVDFTNALCDERFDLLVEQPQARGPAARPGHQGLDGSERLVGRDQAIERRLTHSETPSDILHVGGPKQSRVTLQQAADRFMPAEPFVPTQAVSGGFKLLPVVAHAASNQIKSLERQILK